MFNFTQKTHNKADMHLHTAFSDGTDSPEELIKRLRKHGVTTFSVTDHDNADFYNNIKDNDTYGLSLVTGIEFSCRTEKGKCHILGYGINTENMDFVKTVELTAKLREEKLQKRIDFLRDKHSIVLTDEEKASLFKEKSAGKPHMARILMARGYALSIGEAIDKYLTGIPGGDDRIDAKVAIDAIKKAGGIPVWAHPLGGEGEKRLTSEKFEERLLCLADMGIEGIELYYSRYGKKERTLIKRVLRKNKIKLVYSGGSDYHGANKNIVPGELDCTGKPVLPKKITLLNDLKREQ